MHGILYRQTSRLAEAKWGSILSPPLKLGMKIKLDETLPLVLNTERDRANNFKVLIYNSDNWNISRFSSF